MASFKGITGLVEMDAGEAYDPTRGKTILRRYRGRRADVNALAVTLRAQGSRYETEPADASGYQVIRVSDPSPADESLDAPISDQWSLVGNDIEQDAWMHSDVKALFKSLSADNMAQWRGWARAWAEGQTTVTISDVSSGGEPIDAYYALTLNFLGARLIDFGFPTPIANAEIWAQLNLFLRDLADGVQSISVPSYVLRRVTRLKPGSSVKATRERVGKILTTDELSSLENVPSDVKFDLPPDSFWQKRTPTVEYEATARVLTQEYWQAERYAKFFLKRATA